jgi:multiple sugar transport system permease protein
MMDSQAFNPLKLLALFLLLPAIFLCGASRAAPAVYNAYLSTTDYQGFGEEQSVGLDNYDHLLNDDKNLTKALTFTGQLTLVKVLILAVVPVLIGLIIGAQGQIGRWINRLLLVIVTVGLVPAILSILWRSFWSPYWNMRKGTEGIVNDAPDWLLLSSTDGAPINLSIFHALLFLGIALAVGSVIYMAVARGRTLGRDAALRAGVAAWIILMIWAVLLNSDTFLPPYTITQGGPVNASMTLPLLFYRYFAQQFQLGYAAAIAMPGLIAAALAGIGIWAVMTFFNLRMRFVSSPMDSNSLWSLGSIPLLLIVGFPVVGLIIWGVWYVQSNEAFSQAREIVDWSQTLLNSFLVPWLTIWLIQIPITYLVGITLGFVRPLGRIGSSLLFLPFLMFAILPDNLLSLSWFRYAREAKLLDTASVRSLPWYIGAISLILFKLYFDGAHDRYQEARAAGKDTANALLQDVVLPSLLIVVLVGVVLSFLSAQEFFWPLISQPSQEHWPATMVMFQIQGQYGTQPGLAGGVPILYLGLLAAIFIPVFVLLHWGVLDRLALIAGPTEPTAVIPTHTVVSTIAPQPESVENVEIKEETEIEIGPEEKP